MTLETAEKVIENLSDYSSSLSGEAIDFFLRNGFNYKRLGEKYGISSDRLRSLHRVFSLPDGLKWKIDSGKIKIGHANQIARLENEDDQWMLGFCIFLKNLTIGDSKEIVNSFLRQDEPLKHILHELIGIRFDQIDEPLLLPFSILERLELCKSAWTKNIEWADFCLQSIKCSAKMDLMDLADQLNNFAVKIREACNE